MPIFGATSYQIQVVFVKQINQDENKTDKRSEKKKYK